MSQSAMTSRRVPSHPIYLNEGLSPKKTAFIIVTVIGCIAILWPKVFYPMMFGGSSSKSNLKDQRGSTDFRTGLRQERPAHLHPESIYQAMRERGRAIPSTPTVPIIDRKGSPSNPPPRIVEGRPGPIPGMRPPMGAGSLQQPQMKGSSMGFIMPIYTIGIIVFFAYTIFKIAFKKSIPNAPYGTAPGDANFRKQVFEHGNGKPLDGASVVGTNLHLNDLKNDNELYNASLSAANVASNLSSSLKKHQYQHQQQLASSGYATTPTFNKESDQLLEIEKLRKKLEDTERAMATLIAEMNSDQYEAKKQNETSNTKSDENHKGTTPERDVNDDNVALKKSQNSTERDSRKQGPHKDEQQRKRRDESMERSVAVLGMEVTASCEGGQKWTGRPPTPVMLSHNEHSKDNGEIIPEPQAIYLEGSLAHESQILVSESETRTEEVYDEELNGSPEEPAVVLSSKMTLSLINMDANEQTDNEIDSPLGNDIEIIGHDEH